MQDEKPFAEPADVDVRLLAAFSKTSAIAFCILDNDRRYQLVNDALVAMHDSIPTEAFIGRTLRDILEDAAPDVEARFQRISTEGETPAIEVSVKLPSRTEVGYWLEKSFSIKGRSGSVIEIVCIAVEVTSNRKLEEQFRKLAGELLWKTDDYQQLARELNASVNSYHAALAMSLERLSRHSTDPETIPALLAEPMDFLDRPMRRLQAVIAKCFPLDKKH